MRLITAWSNVSLQNITLRFVVLLLTICIFALSVCTVRLALKAPLIIERECYSKTVTPADPRHTTAEIETFVRIALAKRFDTHAQDTPIFLSPEERAFRIREQDDIGKKGMSQQCLVNSMKIDGSTVTVDADRIISIGKIRSTLAFPLVVTLTSGERTPGNPYGLILQRVAQANNEENKNEKK